MKSAAILAAGIVALALLATLCLPQQPPPSSALLTPPANFQARVEYGTLILRGSLPSESKAAILQQAQELHGATPGTVIDEIAVDQRVEPVAWTDNVSQVLPIFGHMMERGSIIIDGRSVVVIGQVSSDRAKLAVLETIAPLMQTGLELEDRMLMSQSSVKASPKVHSPSTPSKKVPSLVVALAPKVPAFAPSMRMPPSPVVTTALTMLSPQSISFRARHSMLCMSRKSEDLTNARRIFSR